MFGVGDHLERLLHATRTEQPVYTSPEPLHDVESMTAVASMFRDSVCALIEAMGMQAENDQRKALGQSMAYTQADFLSLIK